MDKIKQYKRKSISFLISLLVVGITLLYTFYSVNKIKPNYQQIVPALLIACWLIAYINYVNLKTKVEILKELEKATGNSEK
jgi:TRAP-type C4-dicarboxylate transport system permease small subunit